LKKKKNNNNNIYIYNIEKKKQHVNIFIIFEQVMNMKRRLTYKGKRVYIKTLTTHYALVSFVKENANKVFKLDLKELVAIK